MAGQSGGKLKIKLLRVRGRTRRLAIVYHRTDAADTILEAGFQDGEGNYLTEDTLRVSNVPLDSNEGAVGADTLVLHIPTKLFTEYEWVEEGKGYREALIPAGRLNAFCSLAQKMQP